MPTDRPKKLLDQVREAIQRKHYSPRTAESYIHWIKRFIFFHNKRHPDELGEREIEAFLTHLAVAGRVAASTQNQALSALLFLYRVVLNRKLNLSFNVVRAGRPRRLPTVLTREEVHRVLDHLTGTYQLMARLLYGSGLRLMECVQQPSRRCSAAGRRADYRAWRPGRRDDAALRRAPGMLPATPASEVKEQPAPPPPEASTSCRGRAGRSAGARDDRGCAADSGRRSQG